MQYKSHDGKKFMLSLNPKIQSTLEKHAKKSGISLQELLRTRVIPDWLFGPPVVSNRVIQHLEKKGLIKNGNSGQVSGKRDLPEAT